VSVSKQVDRLIASETSSQDLREFSDNFNDLLIGSVVVFGVVLAVDVVALILHNIYVCRANPDGNETPQRKSLLL